MTAPENVIDENRPINPVFVLDNGMRVPLDLRYEWPPSSTATPMRATCTSTF